MFGENVSKLSAAELGISKCVTKSDHSYRGLKITNLSLRLGNPKGWSGALRREDGSTQDRLGTEAEYLTQKILHSSR